MRLLAKILMAPLIGALPSIAAAQAAGTVIPVTDHTTTLAIARKLLAIQEVDNAEEMALLRNPFEVMLAAVAVVDAAPIEVAPVGHRYNDRQILAAIAPRLIPTGTARVGTTDYLLFGQKKLKEGEMLTITYEGSAYLIEIVTIERNNFRIRLNSEELVRPIK